MGCTGMQFERILAGSVSSNLLQVLHMQSSSTLWLTLLPVQIKELALLHAGVLLLCQYFATAGSMGIPKFAYIPQGNNCSDADGHLFSSQCNMSCSTNKL